MSNAKPYINFIRQAKLNAPKSPPNISMWNESAWGCNSEHLGQTELILSQPNSGTMTEDIDDIGEMRL